MASRGFMRVPEDTRVRVRGATPNPPVTVTPTAPTVFPIPAITTGTMRAT